MGAPSGAVAKLFWREESSPGTFATFNATSGIRLYFESFGLETPQSTIEIPEIRGANTYDHVAFTIGPAAVRGTIRTPLRYAGVYAVLMGWAMGDLVTTGSSPYTHTAKTTDDLFPGSILHQYPVASVAQFSEDHVIGAKPTRMRISASVNQPAFLEIDFVAMEAEQTLTDTSPVPPDDNTGYSPFGFNYSLWNHHDTLTFQRSGGSVKTPGVSDWEIIVENTVAQTLNLGTSRKQSEPFRSGLRTVTARFTMDQDDTYDEMMEIFGKLVSEAPEVMRLNIGLTDPAVTNTEWDFTLSNAYVVTPGRGTSGQELQRKTMEIRAHYNSASPYPNSEALRCVLLSPEEGPGATKYGTLIGSST